MLGKDAFIAQVGSAEDDWVELPWRPDLVDLIEKSYGIRLDDGLFFLEHACRECGRVLTYERTADEDAGEATGQPPDVRIQILGDG